MAVLMQTSNETQIGADQSSKDQEILESVLRECAQFYASQKARTLVIFDRPHGQFLLMDEGWNGFKHIHRVWVHVELTEGKFWVQRDGTEDGIAVDLVNAGIPKERIVLAFQHPARRQYSDFAAS